MLDATQHYAQPLDLERIFRWHRLLSPVRESLLPVRMRVGELRANEPMQVVSGRLEKSWFLQTLLDSLEHALLRIDRVLGKARFWRRPPGGGRSTRYEIDWP